MSYEVSVVANYHKGEAFPFQLLIFLFGRLQELSEHLLEPHLFPEDL